MALYFLWPLAARLAATSIVLLEKGCGEEKRTKHDIEQSSTRGDKPGRKEKAVGMPEISDNNARGEVERDRDRNVDKDRRCSETSRVTSKTANAGT